MDFEEQIKRYEIHAYSNMYPYFSFGVVHIQLGLTQTAEKSFYEAK